MEIKTVVLGYLKTNCYIISTEKAIIIIDPGKDSKQVNAILENAVDKEKLVLLTHCHFDHICGAENLRDNYAVKIAIGKDDAFGLKNPYLNMSDRFFRNDVSFEADTLLEDGQKLQIGDISVLVIKTEGHTRGSVSYLINGALFSGDTLFFESVGNTEFPGGDYTDLKNSIKKLYTLSEETVVYPGHGDITTIAHEKMFNPYVKG